MLLLDFHGLGLQNSVHNLILVDKNTKKEILLFGKENKGYYNLFTKYPLSIFQSFGLALSELFAK